MPEMSMPPSAQRAGACGTLDRCTRGTPDLCDNGGLAGGCHQSTANTVPGLPRRYTADGNRRTPVIGNEHGQPITLHDRDHNHDEEQDQAQDEDVTELSDHIGVEQETPVPPAGTMRAGEAGSQPNDDNHEWVIETGCDVIGNCGHKIGEIVDVEPEYIVVEVGFFHPTDLYVPKVAIDNLHADDVFLNLSKSEALHQGWDEEPST